jgi:cephalosporin hydroxylase
MLRYAELVHELRPEWVLECGTADGGAALFLADMLDRAGAGHVISIDNDPRPLSIDHPRLTLIKGDTIADDTIEQVLGLTRGTRGLILLDDDHSCAHVLAELGLYAPLASYLIVQDTLMGHLPQYPDNPRQALEEWLPAHPEFTADPDPDPTNHPGGWLRRTAG